LETQGVSILQTLVVGFLQALDVVLGLYVWAVILAAIVSTLISFGVLDSRNRFVWSVGDFLYRITEPALRPIRRILPVMGGIDLSPLILLLLIQFVIRRLVLILLVSAQSGQWPALI
jgi:YggT family protein